VNILEVCQREQAFLIALRTVHNVDSFEAFEGAEDVSNFSLGSVVRQALNINRRSCILRLSENVGVEHVLHPRNNFILWFLLRGLLLLQSLQKLNEGFVLLSVGIDDGSGHGVDVVDQTVEVLGSLLSGGCLRLLVGQVGRGRQHG